MSFTKMIGAMILMATSAANAADYSGFGGFVYVPQTDTERAASAELAEESQRNRMNIEATVPAYYDNARITSRHRSATKGAHRSRAHAEGGIDIGNVDQETARYFSGDPRVRDHVVQVEEPYPAMDVQRNTVYYNGQRVKETWTGVTADGPHTHIQPPVRNFRYIAQ